MYDSFTSKYLDWNQNS